MSARFLLRSLAFVLSSALLLAASTSQAGIWTDDIEGFVSPKKGQRLHPEWSLIQKQVDGKNLDEVADAGPMVGIVTGLKHIYTTEPSFEQGYQRTDNYILNVNGSLAKDEAMGLGIQAKVTFSRLYPNRQIARAAPSYFLNRFPSTSKAFLRDLNPGDAVRLLVWGDDSIKKGMGHSEPDFFVGASLQITRGSRMVVDFYRLDQDRVRLRLVTVRETASITGNLKLDPTMQVGGVIALARRIYGVPFRCNVLDLRGTATPFGHFPVETSVVDYELDLSQKPAAQAFEKITTWVRGYRLKNNFLRSPRRIDHEVDDAVAPLNSAGPAVRRLFKGYGLTEFLAQSVGSNCFDLWNASSKLHLSITSFRSQAGNGPPQDQLFVSNRSDKESSLLFRSYVEKESLRVDGIFPGIDGQTAWKKNQSEDVLSGVVITRTLRDSQWRPRESAKVMQDFQYQFPQFASEVDWDFFQFDKKKTRMTVLWSLTFSPRAFDQIQLRRTEDLQAALAQYVAGHPLRRSFMPDPAPPSMENQHVDIHQVDVARNEQFAELAEKIAQLLSPSTVAEDVKALRYLQRNHLFRKVGPGFLVSLLPPQKVRELVRVKLVLGADQGISIGLDTRRAQPEFSQDVFHYLSTTLNLELMDNRIQVNARK